ncbi:Alpha-1,3-arabinosyltransferase XAT3 [Linum perenne]
MTNQSFLGRRLKKHEQKLLATTAVILTCFIIVVGFCALVHQEYDLTNDEDNDDIIRKSGKQIVTEQGGDRLDLRVNVGTKTKKKIMNKVGMCNFGKRSDFCDLKGDVRIDRESATIYYVVESGDQYNLPHCSHIHYSPVIIFSVGGYFGNYFHAFTDVLVSLYVTARPFYRDVTLLVSNYHTFQVVKFNDIIKALSRYQVVDIDKDPQSEKYKCFSRLILGLKGRHDKELSINPSQSEYTIKDFRTFLRSAYSLHKTNAIKLHKGDAKFVPRLLIIAREKTRTVTNLKEITRMARELGYQVTVSEIDTNVTKSAEITNSCDVLIGVHGAGLTNMVFLPENGVLIQIVPYGVDWLSKYYIAEPSKEMNLKYLEYKVGLDESSLKHQYSPDDMVFKNPAHFGWEDFNRIYLQNQDITLDANKFKLTLSKALDFLHK